MRGESTHQACCEGAYDLSKVVTLGPESSQCRTVSFLGRTLTLRQYEADQQHVSRAQVLGPTHARSVATPGTDDVCGPETSEISELRRTTKWREPPEEIKEEDGLLTGGELKLFQSVSARFNYLAMDRPDLLYLVSELMRKMASPRARDLIAFKRVARYTNKFPPMACRYPRTELDSHICGKWRCKLCRMYLYEKVHSWKESRCVVVSLRKHGPKRFESWPCVVENPNWAVGQGSNRKVWDCDRF